MTKKTMGTAIILAGGDSKRFGSPKAFLKIEGETLIEIIVKRINDYFNEIIVVTDQKIDTDSLPVIITGDIITSIKKSSLRGLHAGLSKSSNTDNFVIACDMPFVSIELVKYMHGFLNGCHAVVPRIDQYVQPLYAFYDKKCITFIEDSLDKGNFKLSELYKSLNIKYINREEIEKIDPGEKVFFNINNNDDFKKAKDLFMIVKK